MGLFVRLRDLESYANSRLEGALASAPVRSMLREGVADVIAAIHGMPDVVGVPLSKLEVYIGRAGSSATHLRNRWSFRFGHETFSQAPSTHAVVASRASTDLIRTENWERISQRVTNHLVRRGALCCANAVTGDNGPWPNTDHCAIYVVARARRGPVGVGASEAALARAVLDLLDDDNLDAQVVRAVGRMILDPSRAADHEELAREDDNDDQSPAVYGQNSFATGMITCPRCEKLVPNVRFCGMCGLSLPAKAT